MDMIVHGATGRMGRILCELADAQGHTVSAKVAADAPLDAAVFCRSLSALPAASVAAADCVIDFSNHAATADLLSFCKANRLPVVIATTGQTEAEKVLISDVSKEIPIFFSANMSIGIAVLADLARRAAAAFPTADIEIVEIHHNQKLDVPSGTALLLAKSIQNVRKNATLLIGRHENGKRTAQEIGIHSLRLGNEVGTHEVLISTGNEVITLKHEAKNRALFADGALAAAAWLIGRPAGLYSMQDMMV